LEGVGICRRGNGDEILDDTSGGGNGIPGNDTPRIDPSLCYDSVYNPRTRRYEQKVVPC